MRWPRWWRWIAIVTVATIAAAASTALTGHRSLASAPPPPPGFSTVFLDDFNGPAGSPVSGSDWLYDLGHSYPGGAPNWGTGEVEAMTNSTANVFQDGQSQLHIKALRDGAGNWTSG